MPKNMNSSLPSSAAFSFCTHLQPNIVLHTRVGTSRNLVSGGASCSCSQSIRITSKYNYIKFDFQELKYMRTSQSNLNNNWPSSRLFSVHNRLWNMHPSGAFRESNRHANRRQQTCTRKSGEKWETMTTLWSLFTLPERVSQRLRLE